MPSDQPATPATPDDGVFGRDRRIPWLELFFDLVVVAGLGALTEGLRTDVGTGGALLFAILFAAIWLTWVNVVLYANIARDETHIWTVIIVMMLIAVMASTSPNHFEDRANAFAIAFLVARAILARRALATGRIVSGWPLLQFGGLTAIWIVAMFVPVPGKYWLWGIALTLDLFFVAFSSEERTDKQLARLTKKFDVESVESRRRRRGLPELVKVNIEPEHLGERMGVFVIIVLGESVIQIVHGAAATEWDLAYDATVTGAFLILVGLWWLRFSYGSASAPRFSNMDLPPQYALPLHMFATMGIALLAAGLGELAHGDDHPLTDAFRWVMCAGMALCFLSILVGGLLGTSDRRWLVLFVVPGVVVPLLVGAFGHGVENVWLCWLLLIPIGWQAPYAARHPTAVAPTNQ